MPQSQVADVADPVFDDAVPLDVGAGRDQAGQFRFQGTSQQRWPAAARPIPQAVHAFRVVAHDPITQRLSVHASLPGRFFPADPVQRHGNRQQAPANPPIARAAGQDGVETG